MSFHLDAPGDPVRLSTVLDLAVGGGLRVENHGMVVR
jgi:hypothetical protein